MPKLIDRSSRIYAASCLVVFGNHMAPVVSKEITAAPHNAVEKARAAILRFRNDGSNLDPNNPAHVRGYMQITAAGFARVSAQKLETFIESAIEKVSHGFTTTLIVWAVPIQNIRRGLTQEMHEKLKTLADMEGVALVP